MSGIFKKLRTDKKEAEEQERVSEFQNNRLAEENAWGNARGGADIAGALTGGLLDPSEVEGGGITGKRRRKIRGETESGLGI